ncbi:MAG: hypothetical protein PV344_03595 [Anaplasma sp.]|nr:hypothetical protein [Anaplasma sp.]
MKLFAGSNLRESSAGSVVLTYCPNCSRDLFFANPRQFAKFAKIRSSQKFSRLQYIPYLTSSVQCCRNHGG